MKHLLKKYKPVVKFLGIFLGVFLLLSFLYAGFLKFSYANRIHPDRLTALVAKQTTVLLEEMKYSVNPRKDILRNEIVLTMNPEFEVRIVEGCNSASVIILFVSFVIAFARGFKKTLIFLLAGSAVIYTVNLFRIVLLAVLLMKYPMHQEILHSVVFPGIIYALVFMLWIIWVQSLKK